MSTRSISQVYLDSGICTTTLSTSFDESFVFPVLGVCTYVFVPVFRLYNNSETSVQQVYTLNSLPNVFMDVHRL